MAEQYDIDKLFREAQESRAGTPPAEAWERINETLDVDATWARLGGVDPAYAALDGALARWAPLGRAGLIDLARRPEG